MAQPISRLALLMQLLNITGREMAAALHIDHSLISKWKNNHRKIPVRMGMLGHVADYLISCDQKKTHSIIYPLLINPTANKIHPDKISKKDRLELYQALVRWLQESGPVNPMHSADQHTQYWQSDLHYICPVEVYQSDAGRRQAVDNLFDTLLSLPSSQELWILAQEDAEWMISDEQFSKRIKDKMLLAAERGHVIKIIHWLEQQHDQLSKIVEFWMPLQFHPQIQSWYYPKYDRFGMPLTLYILPNQAVLTGISSFESPPLRQTMLFRDLHTIQSYAALFKSYLKDSRFLFQSYSGNETTAWITQLYHTELQGTSQNIYVQAEQPSALLLPRSLISRHIRHDLSQNLYTMLDSSLSPEIKRPASSNRVLEVSESEHLPAIAHVRHIYHLGSLIQGRYKAMIKDHFLSVILGRTITLEQNQYKKMLLGLASYLQTHEHFEIALINDNEYRKSEWPNLVLIADHMFLAWSSQPDHARLSTHESTLLHAMHAYLDKRWQEIPSVCRHREKVVEQLHKLCNE